MSRDLQDLHREIQELPEGDRLWLIGRLIADLDVEEDEEAEELWLQEAEKRYRSYKAGELSGKPAKNAIEDARSSLE